MVHPLNLRHHRDTQLFSVALERRLSTFFCSSKKIDYIAALRYTNPVMKL